MARLTMDDAASTRGFHHPPRAKRMVWLFQSGGPSQLDLFDPKPALTRHHGEDLPASVRMGQRLTTMSGHQAKLPLAASSFRFSQHGECGASVSELLPNLAKIVDDVTFVRSLTTDAINHDPAITFFQTGSAIAGRPSIGSWLDYGLGTENSNLPGYVVLVTKGRGGQPIYSRLWGPGFLPGRHEGVQFRAERDPVLWLRDPAGVERATRRRMLDALRALHEDERAIESDPSLDDRVAQFELAFRMQREVPDLTDLSDEPKSTFALYGEDARTPGTYAANCLLARRLLERGVRFVQLFHRDWDHHGNLPSGIRGECRATDRGSAALVLDLKRRGLLNDTIVAWGGEFGRTSYSQGKLTANDYGRDHHPRCFTWWLAGGGFRPGLTFGETDELGYNVAHDPVSVHDLHATVLHQLGIDHERLTWRFLGRRYRLTDVHGRVVRELLTT
ncbi:MAG: DUF1501 domain-containing protein [Planctomycetota bacterium]